MFTTSVPVTGPGFLDRRDELQRVADAFERLRAGSPQWIAILGPRKIGKTSLLLEAARRARGGALRFVAIDAFEVLPVSLEIVRSYALKVLDVVLGPDLATSLEALAARPADYREALLQSPVFSALPAEVRSTVIELPEAPVEPATLRRWLDLPERLCHALGLHLVAAWDEFQELLAIPGGRRPIDLPPLLRSAWQHHQRVAYVISGSARTTLTELVTARHSPFFQHFAVLDVGPFPREESVRLLTGGAEPARAIPVNLAERAHELLGGNPFYLQVLGEALAAGNEEPSLKAALGETLFSRTGRLALYFENDYQRLVGRATTLAATLQSLAVAPRRLTEIATAIGASSGSAAQYVDRLGDAVVHGEDGLYSLADRAFGLWLRWRGPGGTVVPMKLLGDEAERRVAEELARMGFELVYQSRASRGAFDLLAIRGTHQLGIQVKRSALPLRFDTASWNRMAADAERLGWRFVVAAQPPGEREPVLFLDPAAARRSRGVSLDHEAAIPNLLAWLGEGGPARGGPRKRRLSAR